MKTIYVAMQNQDLTEGRGPMRPRGHFTEEQDALDFLETLPGIMGTRQGLKVEPVQVYERISEHPDWTEDQLRQIALSKLSPEERKVLGV